ncbi:histone-like nucleoid-structuring protein Lsr2, partial [Streptomyces exfoliatus]
MAQKVQVLLIDDIDGGTADETVTFGLDGKTYEIDLKEVSAAKLREALAPFIKAGRRVGGASSRAVAGTRSRSTAKPAQDGSSTERMRRWARD